MWMVFRSTTIPSSTSPTTIIGGTVPKEYIPGVEKGVKSVWENGMLIGFPLVSGFAFLVISSALMELSTEINEASLLDGCSPLRRVFAIDIPSIIGPTVLVIILSINAGLQEFAPMLVISSGGPVNSTQTPGLYLYQVAFTYGKFGYATAIGTVLMMLTLAFSFFTLRARYRGATDVEVQ